MLLVVRGAGASRSEPTSERVAGVTTEKEDAPVVSETILVEGMDDESLEREGRDCWGVRIGRDGSGGAGCARDM